MKTGILITGGAGLLAANWAVLMRNHYAVTLALHTRKISISGTCTRKVDLNSVDAITALLYETNPSIVIHSAGMTSVEACEAEPLAAFQANVQIARNVALACKQQGAKLVHISTDHLFSGFQSMISESSVARPINVYAKTKAAGEVAVLEACTGVIVARTNFFGWGLPYRKSFSDTIIDSLRSGKEIGLFSDVYFTPILISQLTKAVHKLVEAEVNGIFNIVGDERLSKYEFGMRIAQKFGFSSDLIKPTLFAERRDLVQRPLDMSLDNQKLCAVIGHKICDLNSQLTALRMQECQRPLIEMVC
jgi:dTDP-4-dehydrorhamnose reductase